MLSLSLSLTKRRSCVCSRCEQFQSYQLFTRSVDTSSTPLKFIAILATCWLLLFFKYTQVFGIDFCHFQTKIFNKYVSSSISMSYENAGKKSKQKCVINKKKKKWHATTRFVFGVHFSTLSASSAIIRGWLCEIKRKKRINKIKLMLWAACTIIVFMWWVECGRPAC